MQLENCIRNAYDLEGRHIGHLLHSFCICSQYASNISVEIFIFETWSFAPRSLISMNHAYDSVMCDDNGQTVWMLLEIENMKAYIGYSWSSNISTFKSVLITELLAKIT